MIPNTDFLKCEKDERGYTITGENIKVTCDFPALGPWDKKEWTL